MQKKQKLNLSHILTQHKYELEDVLRLLKAGESFQQLARKYSLCSSARDNGSLGVVSLHLLDEDFATAAEKLSVNELSPIVKTRFGYHLIQRHEDSQ